MKKVWGLMTVMLVVGSMWTPSFSLFQVQGVYSSYAKGSSVGAGIELPIIPFIPTTLYLSQFSDTNITCAFTYLSKTFSGTIPFKSFAADFQFKLPLPDVAGFTFGADVMVDLLTGRVSGSDVAMPGNVYAGLFAQYNQNLLPLVSAFGQLGYLAKVVDTQTAIKNDSSFTGTIDLSAIDRSGLFWRAGVAIGF